LTAEVRRWMTVEDAVGVVHSDGARRSRAHDRYRAAAQIRGPWGLRFPKAVFDDVSGWGSRVVGGASQARGPDGRQAHRRRAIAFRHFDDADAPQVQPDAKVELAYRLDVNQYNGLEKVQLVVEYLRVLSG
jgi:single-stranded-DNA-specific exonuclease